MSYSTQPIPSSLVIERAESFIDTMMSRPSPKNYNGLNHLVVVLGVPAIDEADLDALDPSGDLPPAVRAARRGYVIAGLPSKMSDIVLRGLAKGIPLEHLLKAGDAAFRKGRADGARLVDAQYVIHLYCAGDTLFMGVYPKRSVIPGGTSAMLTIRDVICLEDTAVPAGTVEEGSGESEEEDLSESEEGGPREPEGTQHYQHLILPSIWEPWLGDTQEVTQPTMKSLLEWGLPPTGDASP